MRCKQTPLLLEKGQTPPFLLQTERVACSSPSADLPPTPTLAPDPNEKTTIKEMNSRAQLCAGGCWVGLQQETPAVERWKPGSSSLQFFRNLCMWVWSRVTRVQKSEALHWAPVEYMGSPVLGAHMVALCAPHDDKCICKYVFRFSGAQYLTAASRTLEFSVPCLLRELEFSWSKVTWPPGICVRTCFWFLCCRPVWTFTKVHVHKNYVQGWIFKAIYIVM